MKQPKQRPTPAEADQERLTRLAAGELKGWAAYRLRRRIACDAGLRREWEATASLWKNLGALRAAPAPARPDWSRAENRAQSSLSKSPLSKSPIWTLGGIAMHRNIAIVAIAGIALTTVSAGAIVTNRWLHDPFLDFQDRQQHVWRVTNSNFRGEVKQYDARGNSIGSLGADWDSGHEPLTAEVVVDGRQFHLTGKGKHTLRDAAGTIVGYADLVPETPAERAAGQAAYLRRTGIDEVLRTPHGDVNNANEDFGFFGEHHEITFRITGSGQARFTRRDNGHVVLNAYATRTAPEAINPTVFRWTQNGVTHTLRHIGASAEFTLSDGTPLRVEIIPHR